jgi:hypothetical protein
MICSVAEMSTDLPQTGSNKGPSQNNSTTDWGPQAQHICTLPDRYPADGTDEKHKENNANALVGSIGNGDGTNPWNGIDPSASIDGWTIEIDEQITLLIILK